MGFNLSSSNIQDIIKKNGTSVITTTNDSSSTLAETTISGVIQNFILNGKKITINSSHLLYPGIIGSTTECTILKQYPVNIIDGSKLSGDGAKMFNNAKVWHTHKLKINGVYQPDIYELVYTTDNTYFYRKRGNIANETDTSSIVSTKIENDFTNNTTYTSTYTINKYDNTGQVNNENISNSTINKFINEDIYQNVIIILNMNKNLCTNKSICYLKFDFIIDNYNVVYKTIYVKYYNSTGLLSKQLYSFYLNNDQEKRMLQMGYIRITAYQLADCSDSNPYIIGKFAISKFLSKSKLITLYKFFEIDDIYKFTFDNIDIYPISISGELYKLNNDYISIYKNGNIINSSTIVNKIYNYMMDWNYVSYSNNYTQFHIKSIVINIDNDEILDKYQNFYCNITFYVKNGNNYILPNAIFNKLGNQLILNEVVKVKQNIYHNIVKFSINNIHVIESKGKTKLNIKLSTQGNIINN